MKNNEKGGIRKAISTKNNGSTGHQGFSQDGEVLHNAIIPRQSQNCEVGGLGVLPWHKVHAVETAKRRPNVEPMPGANLNVDPNVQAVEADYWCMPE